MSFPLFGSKAATQNMFSWVGIKLQAPSPQLSVLLPGEGTHCSGVAMCGLVTVWGPGQGLCEDTEVAQAAPT